MCSDLKEGKDKANGEVRYPVEATSHGVGRWSVRLFEQLCSDQEGHAG